MTRPFTVQVGVQRPTIANIRHCGGRNARPGPGEGHRGGQRGLRRLEKLDRSCLATVIHRCGLRGRRCRIRGETIRSRFPDGITEHGEPPVVTLTGPVRPAAVEVSGGRVTVRIVHERGTVTSEICDPPHPAANKPLVTVRRRPDGAPEVEVTGGTRQECGSSTSSSAPGVSAPPNHQSRTTPPLRRESGPALSGRSRPGGPGASRPFRTRFQQQEASP